MIKLLSSNAAAYLRSIPYARARLVVGQLALMISFWESSNVALDPVQREVIFDSIVYAFSTLYAEFEGAIGDMAAALYQSSGSLGG